MGKVAGVVVAVVLGVLVACHRNPEPTYEYGETVTYTSTADDAPPQRAIPSESVPAAPAASPTREAPPAASEVAESDDTVAVEGGEWVTTVDPASPPPSGGATDDAPTDAAPPEPNAVPAPPATAAEPVQPGRWYKAKRW